MVDNSIGLIACLGNPGAEYSATRHNAGFWFMDELQRHFSFDITNNNSYKSKVGDFILNTQKVRVIAPQAYMNLSGQCIVPYSSFYKIPSNRILVVHDELDLAPGICRLKKGGGHGGHNGLRDIHKHLGDNNYLRLRIGIGKQSSGQSGAGFVLGRPPEKERMLIDDAIRESMSVIEQVIDGDIQTAMTTLHTQSPS